MEPEQYLPRLAFIKHLFSVAQEQSREPMPMAAKALLSLQDSVEMFLYLACERVNAQVTPKTTFAGYFDLINDKLSVSHLSGQSSMIKLNNARVNLKHYGNRPDPADLKEFTAAAGSFFEDNTRLVFGVAFSEVSLTSLVQNAEARALLEAAVVLVDQGSYADAAGKITLAFEYILDQHLEATRHIPISRNIPRLSSTTVHKLKGLDRNFADFVDYTTRAINALESDVRLLILGIDSRKYAQFKMLTPIVVKPLSGGCQVLPRNGGSPSLEDCRYCLDFVIDTAVRLQEFTVVVDDPFSKS